MKRVFSNLIDNAVAACLGSKLEAPKVSITSKFDAELKILRIIVADNGPGIPTGDRQRVFEPYYSTKESGTGLGLAIVKRIIEDHNGFIRVMANDSRGTRMVIELPITEANTWKPTQPNE